MSNRRSRPGREVFSVLFDITQRLNEGADLESVLADIARAVTEVSQAEAGSVLLLDETRASLLCRASYGLPPEEVDRIEFKVGEGIAGWAAAEGMSVRLADASTDARFKALQDQTTRIRSICCVPLITRDGVIGVISASAQTKNAFDDEDERLLRFLAASIVKDVENARLYRLAVTDPLTRAFNRQWLAERLPQEMERHRRYSAAFSVIMADVDHFKDVNDTHGHAVGDEVLVAIAHRAHEVLREVDAVIRYGGEEFLLLLPSTDRDGAQVVADRLRERVGNTPVETTAGPVTVTVSAGVAQMAFGDEHPRDLIARADAALYEAKGAGRNQVVVAPS